MQFLQTRIKLSRVLVVFPLVLLFACVSRPELKPKSERDVYYDSQAEYYFEHINDDPEQVAIRPVISDAPLAVIEKNPDVKTKKTIDKKPDVKVPPPKLSLTQRMPKAKTSDKVPSWISNKNYSFKANKLDVRQALKMFSKIYGLNIYYEPEVKGKISVEFTGLPLKKALEVILSSHKFYWQWQGNLIYVGKYQTKDYIIDYIRLTRKGTGKMSASGQGGSRSSISSSDTISFWDELEKQLSSLISKSGTLTINKMTGNIQVTDTPDHIAKLDRYINNIKKTLTRQVIIEARILEVQLNDDNRLGIDWGKINFLNFSAVTSTLSGLSSGGLNLKAATSNLTYNDGRFQTMISALAEQGNVKVMSQPRIRTLNNQPAIIKAGTDRTFFATTATTTTNNGVTQVVTSETPTTVTEGLVLSITPQISDDGKIILDITPVITRISDVTISQYGSTAPVLEIKQTSALIQADDGEMIVIGGMIQDIKVKRSRRVPLLGDIPWIGRLFSSDSTTYQRTELVIYLVAKII